MLISTDKKKISLSTLIFLLFLVNGSCFAQIVIGTPNLNFSQACASNDFNTYGLSFVFSPESGLNPSNQFVLELSDADGDFTNASVIYTSNSGEITTSPATINFQLPTTAAGENYRLRVKSTAPVATSAPSTEFAAYYKLQDSPFTINNLVSTAAYCAGGSYLLTIDNPGTGTNDSPLNYPTLTYRWFRETSPTTSEFISDGSSLSVSEEGTYFVETNYGSCTSDSFSNRVTVTEASGTGNANTEIVSSLGNPYCPEQGLTTLTTIGGISYQWFKDGFEIPDATSQMYQTNESGTFSVLVDLGDCSATGTIELVSELFDSDINVEEENYMLIDETLTITITDTATNPIYDWYFNDELIVGESSNTFTATAFGNYEVVITETTGCTASVSYPFTIFQGFDPFPDVEKIPNVVSPNGDLINDTWVLPLKYVTGTNTEIVILNEQGKVVFQTIDYQNNWPESDLNLSSVNQVFYYIITTMDGEEKKGSITVIK
ncbi:MAG: gliding motility-associated C-terminal domain-containing protein [Winogradskyella sp.]